VKFTALYFGTFNPIHLGHIALGKYFAKQADIEAVWFVVTPQNPFKVNEALLDDGYRLEMVRLALETNPSSTLLKLNSRSQCPIIPSIHWST